MLGVVAFSQVMRSYNLHLGNDICELFANQIIGTTQMSRPSRWHRQLLPSDLSSCPVTAPVIDFILPGFPRSNTELYTQARLRPYQAKPN